MNKTLRIVVFVIVVLAVALGVWFFGGRNTAVSFDPLNATYTIEGQPVTLVDGKSSVPAAPGSATQVTTLVFSEPASGDLNNDGKPDAALILVQNPGGSGTFYYAAAAINTPGGAVGTNAILLGDRIAPENISIANGKIVANYADRNPGEPMTAAPSLGVTKYFSYNGSALRETAPTAGPGEHCGGNMMNAPICGAGYHCAPSAGSHLPFGDVGGTCVAN